jgi:sarcosine oxidase subunit alpha
VAELARDARLERLIELVAPGEVVAWYDDGAVAVVRGRELLVSRPPAVVLATGGHEHVLPFVGGDLPGVLTAGAARRLLYAHGLRPGWAAIVLTDRTDGYRLAAELDSAGVVVSAVADLRFAAGVPADDCDDLASRTIPWLTGVRDMQVHGLRSVRAVTLSLSAAAHRRSNAKLACDTVCVAVGARPALELARQHRAAGRFALASPALPASRDGLETASPGCRLWLAGGVNGTWSAEEAIAEGADAGRAAAVWAGETA